MVLFLPQHQFALLLSFAITRRVLHRDVFGLPAPDVTFSVGEFELLLLIVCRVVEEEIPFPLFPLV